MWQSPKIDWASGDYPTEADFNRIEENTRTLKNDKANLVSPNFLGTPKAPAGTDYTTMRIRNISISRVDLQEGVSSLPSGNIVIVVPEPED